MTEKVVTDREYKRSLLILSDIENANCSIDEKKKAVFNVFCEIDYIPMSVTKKQLVDIIKWLADFLF